jgi:hypothetical protein
VTGQKVDAEVTTLEEPNLLVLRPAAPMVAGHAHEVWAVVHVEGGRSEYGRPSTTVPDARESLVVQLAPVARKAGKAAPKLKSVQPRFEEWGDFDGNMAHLRAAGRTTDLKLDAASPAPAMVLLKGSYDAGNGSMPTQWKAAFAHGPLLNIGGIYGVPCHGDGPPRPPAPREGTFELVVTPWSSTGVVGAAVTAKGAIKTSK